MERGRRVVEERPSLLGPPPGKLRRIDGPGLSREAPMHSHVSHQPALQRVVSPSDRPLSVTVSRETHREERVHRPLMDLKIQVNPSRRIKLNREVTRRGSADTSPSGTESSIFSSVPPKGNGRIPESSLRRETSLSGERRQGPSSSVDSKSERERDRDRGHERTRDRSSSSQKAVAKEPEEEHSTRSEQKNSGGGRSVCLDKMTIAEKSAKRQTDHPDQPSAVQKDRERKSDRSFSKDRTDRAVSSGEKPAAAQREAKESQEPPAKTRPRISRKALTSHSGSSSRSSQESKSNSVRQQKHTSSQLPPEQKQERSFSTSPARSPSRVQEPLIQPPPRSKWEDDEESQDNEPTAHPEPSPKSQRSTEREAQIEASKAAKTKEDKRPRPKKEEAKGLNNFEKTVKTKVVREEGKGAKEEPRVVREDRIVDNKQGGSELRAPEPRRQRLCSDLARETDEAAFVPDYSEGEGSEAERGPASCSPSVSLSQPSRSPSLNNNNNDIATSGGDKKKKKHKKQKKHKKHKDREHKDREHKHKHKKKKRKKSKEQEEGDQAEEDQEEKGAEGAEPATNAQDDNKLGTPQ